MNAPSRREYEWDTWDEPPGNPSRVRVVTPLRLLLLIVIVLAGAVSIYGLLFERPPLQLPITVSGLTVLGLALGLLAFSSAGAAAGLGREGRLGRAMVIAVFGGLFAMAAAGALAMAIVLGILATAG